MRQNYPIENPRKFSEKIALHTHKQRQEIAEFDAVMRDLRSDLYREPPVGQTPLPTINSFDLFGSPHRNSFHQHYPENQIPLNVLRRSLPGRCKVSRGPFFHKQSELRCPQSDFYAGERTHSEPFLPDKLHQNMYMKDGVPPLDYTQPNQPFLNPYYPPWTSTPISYNSYPSHYNRKHPDQYLAKKPAFDKAEDESYLYYRPVHDSGVYEPPTSSFQPHRMMNDSFEDYSNSGLFRDQGDYFYHTEATNRDSTFSNVSDSFVSNLEPGQPFDFYGVGNEEFMDGSGFGEEAKEDTPTDKYN